MLSRKLKSRFASAVLSGAAMLTAGYAAEQRTAASAPAGTVTAAEPADNDNPVTIAMQTDDAMTKDGVTLCLQLIVTVPSEEMEKIIKSNPIFMPMAAAENFGKDVGRLVNEWWKTTAAQIDTTTAPDEQKQVIRDNLILLGKTLQQELGLKKPGLTPKRVLNQENKADPEQSLESLVPQLQEPEAATPPAQSPPQEDLTQPQMAQQYPGFDDTDMFNATEKRPFVSFARTPDGALLMAKFNAYYSTTDMMKLEVNGNTDKISQITDIVQRHLDTAWKNFGARVPSSFLLGHDREAQAAAPMLAKALEYSLAAAQVEIEAKTGMSVLISPPLSIDPYKPDGSRPEQHERPHDKFRENPKRFTL